MSYAYVVLREQDGRFYLRSSGDLRARLRRHSSGGPTFLATSWNGTRVR